MYFHNVFQWNFLCAIYLSSNVYCTWFWLCLKYTLLRLFRESLFSLWTVLLAWSGLLLTSYMMLLSATAIVFIFWVGVVYGGCLCLVFMSSPWLYPCLCVTGSGSKGSTRSQSSNASGHAATPGAVSLWDFTEPALQRVRQQLACAMPSLMMLWLHLSFYFFMVNPTEGTV